MHYIDPTDTFAGSGARWQPRLLGRHGDQVLRMVAFQGPLPWQGDGDTEALCVVLHGSVVLRKPGGETRLGAGATFVAPRSRGQCAVAEEEAHLLLIERHGVAGPARFAAASDQTLEPATI